MRKIIASLILAPILLLAGGKADPQQKALVLTRLTIIDVTGGPPKPDMTVVINGAHITDVGEAGKVSVPQGGRVIDERRHWLIRDRPSHATRLYWAVERVVYSRLFPDRTKLKTARINKSLHNVRATANRHKRMYANRTAVCRSLFCRLAPVTGHSLYFNRHPISRRQNSASPQPPTRSTK
jgi:hypothetical protein